MSIKCQESFILTNHFVLSFFFLFQGIQQGMHTSMAASGIQGCSTFYPYITREKQFSVLVLARDKVSRTV